MLSKHIVPLAMPEAEKFEHFQVLNHPDGSPWELGRGAMGVTYKAFDTNLRCDVALKVINPQFLSSDTARQRFVREARAAAQLRHPNVATVFHLGNSGDGFFYVMEYVDGETVESRIRREGPFRAELALRITRQVARALVAAERQKLVHRDIKPSNLMLVNEADEEHLLVKVIDFGLAKSVGVSSDKSVTVTLGGFVGTPHFASPEQLEEREIDARSDIYSLGATLWYMLSGRPPYEGSMASVIHQHLGSELPEDLLRSFNPKVTELLRRMLAKRAEDRFQTAVELKQALDELLTDSESGDLSGVVTATDPAATVAAENSRGYATGQIISNRYEILERLPPGLLKAKDLQTNRVIGLRPFASSMSDGQQSETLRAEIAKLRNVHHPNLTAIYGLESTDHGLLLVSEWTRGFTFQELLRSRGELRWPETVRLVQPLAKLLDFLADRELLLGSIAVGDVKIEPVHPNEDLDALRKAPVETWPPFVVKVDSLATAGIQGSKLPEPTETRVRPSAATELVKNPVRPLAQLIYELLGGVSHYADAAAGAPGRFAPVPALSEAGNTILRPGVLEPTRFPSAVEFLTDLERAESATQPPLPLVAGTGLNPTHEVDASETGGEFAHRSPARPDEGGSHTYSAVAPTQVPPDPVPTGVVEEEHRAVTSPWLLRIMTIAIVLFGLAALGTVVGISFFLNRQAPVPKEVTHEGFVTLDTKPPGASVQWKGQPIGTTPLASYRLPAGKQTLELQFPGYVNKSVEVVVTEGTINNLGLVSLAREAGQFVVKTNPPGVPFEINSPNQKTTSGVTPLTVDNMPTGKYQVTLKRPGWPDVIKEVELTQGASVNVEHSYQGVNVSLKSDPTGATIYFAGSALGRTPLAVNLPSGQIELTSKIGSLTPVTQRFVVDPSGNTVVEFKHTYGLLSVTCDRSDADVVIGGVDLGKPPIEGILPPGKQFVEVKVEGRPEQVRTADIQAGKRVVLEFTFGGTPSTEPVSGAPNNSEASVPRASPVETPVNPSASPSNPTDTLFQGRPVTNAEATPIPTGTPPPIAAKPSPTSRPRSTPSPVYRTKEDWDRAKDDAYRKFDAQWDAKKNGMKQEKKYIDYWIDHSSGEVKEQWKYKKKVLEDRMNRLDDEKDAARKQLGRQWSGD
ncbi:MAG: protein kinase [Verrucomicrobia bacterium]|nr:protein kinase [Verrucomicrobiota bacterium]